LRGNQKSGKPEGMETFRDHIRRAIDLAGSQRALAEQVGLSQQGISYLLNDAPQVSAEIAIAIHRATDGRVSKEKLRPDIFDVSS
jgi:DNA-binding transcriptional regulator YdaS (Cro superfamily)